MATPVETLAHAHDLAVVAAMDPTRTLMMIPATIGAVGTAASVLTVVKKGEMGIRTFGGHPELQSDIATRVRGDIALAAERHGTLTKRDRSDIREETLAKIDEERLAEGIYKIVGPGLYTTWPVVGGIATIPVNRRTTVVNDAFPVESTDGQQHLIKPAFVWRVRRDGDNPHHARFNVNNDSKMKAKERDEELEQTIAWICLDGLKDSLKGRSSYDLQNLDSAEVTQSTRVAREAKLLVYGVELVDILFRPIARTPEERLAQALESMSPDDGRAGAGAAAAIHTLSKANILQMPPHDPTDAA